VVSHSHCPLPARIQLPVFRVESPGVSLKSLTQGYPSHDQSTYGPLVASAIGIQVSSPIVRAFAYLRLRKLK
jgi:hypothetical protein